LQKVCFEARDKGSCKKPGCTFDHDRAKVEAARMVKKARDAEQSQGQTCFNCGGPGHYARDCTMPKGKGKGKPNATNAFGDGHKGKKGGRKGDKGGGKGNYGAGGKSDDTKRSELCIKFLAGKCLKTAKDCKYSHDQKQADRIRQSVMSLSAPSGASGSVGGDMQLTEAQVAQIAAIHNQKTATSVAAAMTGGSQAPGGQGPPQSSWTLRGPDGKNIFTGVWGEATHACIRADNGAAVEMIAMIEQIAATKGQSGLLTSLSELPDSDWSDVEPPRGGYQFRTYLQCANVLVETLIDSGAATNVVAEEVVLYLMNTARSAGQKPGDKNWPVLAFERWGREDEATGVAAHSPLIISCMVVLNIFFVGTDGKTVRQPLRFKVFKKGCAGWLGLIIGGPTCDRPPAGLGHRATLGAHKFEALGVMCPRLEERQVSERIEQMIALVNGAQQEATCVPLASQYGSFAPVQAALWRPAEDLDSDADDEDPTGGAIVTRGAPGESVVLLDADHVVLHARSGAMVPATLATADRVREVRASTVGIFTHEHSQVRTVSGSWDGDASSGMVLVVNAEPYDVELQRGDVVAAAYAVPATPDEDQAAVAAATAGSRGPRSLPPDVAHIVEKPGAIDAMMETELPPQEYYTALRKDFAERFPAADTFLLDHLVSL